MWLFMKPLCPCQRRKLCATVFAPPFDIYQLRIARFGDTHTEVHVLHSDVCFHMGATPPFLLFSCRRQDLTSGVQMDCRGV
jgi:hypothetical protein